VKEQSRPRARIRPEGADNDQDELLRIGELARRAGVSTRTVDYYTGLGLLTPSARSGGNFRLYHSSDAGRIAAIRQLERHGIRLEDIGQVLAPPDSQARRADGNRRGPGPDPRAFSRSLKALEQQLAELRVAARGADPRTRHLLAALTARAQALMATAVLLSHDLLPGSDLLPPL
jgi:MerR family copper efflux transcriptional regulator